MTRRDTSGFMKNPIRPIQWFLILMLLPTAGFAQAGGGSGHTKAQADSDGGSVSVGEVETLRGNDDIVGAPIEMGAPISLYQDPSQCKVAEGLAGKAASLNCPVATQLGENQVITPTGKFVMVGVVGAKCGRFCERDERRMMAFEVEYTEKDGSTAQAYLAPMDWAFVGGNTPQMIARNLLHVQVPRLAGGYL
jgi:hypothetical protein